MIRRFILGFAAGTATLLGTVALHAFVNFEEAPIRYSETPARDVVAQLAAAIEAGDAALEHDAKHGFLPDLLARLDVLPSSQALVFSKTSRQRPMISPEHPRSLYFNDEVYVGTVVGGYIEIAVADPALGMVFYTLEPDPEGRPSFVRETDACLTCHAQFRTRNVPGLRLDSVFVDAGGEPIDAGGVKRVNHTTPFETRWGGWYVQGTHGDMWHRGNQTHVAEGRPKASRNEAAQNVTNLADRIDLSPFLVPTSDLVALTVLAHQADAHNYLAAASFAGQKALHDLGIENPEAALTAEQQAIVQPAIDRETEALLTYLLMSGEAPLRAPIAGPSSFAVDFARQGPHDRRGRSLRDLDLETRLLRHPLSYLVYSTQFRGMPAIVRTRFFTRLEAILAGEDNDAAFAHLRPADRRAIAEILVETYEDLPVSFARVVDDTEVETAPETTSETKSPEDDADWIETITVIGSGSDGGTLGGFDLKALPVNSMVVNRQEIDRIKFVDPDEFLDRIPGESQVRNLRIPVGNKSYTTPLVDGLPLGSPYRGATQDITDVNAFDIERIEIVKGPASALYASNAFGGTINVITRVPPADPQARVWLEGGDFSRMRAGAHAAGSIGDFGYFVDANTQTADGLRETFRNDRDQFSIKGVYTPSDRTRVLARGERIDRNEVFPGDLLQSEFDQNPRQQGRVAGSDEEVTSDLGAFKLEQSIGRSGQFEVGYVFRGEASEGLARFQGPNRSELEDETLKAWYSHSWNAASANLIAGFERFDGGTDFVAFEQAPDGTILDTVRDSSDSGVDITSFFGQLNLSPHADVTVTLGVRSEDVALTSRDRLSGMALAKEFSKTVPKLGAVWAMGNTHQLWFNYAEGFLTPDLDDLFIDRNANPDLEPEEAQNVEVGVRGASGMVRYEASIYHTDISNFIVTEELVDAQGAESLRFTNAGQVNVRGLEAVVEYQASDRLSFGLSYTYARNIFDRFFDRGVDLSGNRLSRSPEHHVNLRAAYLPIDRLAIELEFDAYSDYFTSNDNESDPLGTFTRGERINLRVAYDFGRWQFWVHGLNLTDTLEDRAGFSRGRRAIRIIDGRNFYAGVGFRF